MSLFDSLKKAAGLGPLGEMAADKGFSEGPVKRFGEPQAQRPSAAPVEDGQEPTQEMPPVGMGGGRDVMLERNDDRKIQAIKVVRRLTGLGLREAKELVERAPCVVISDVGEAFAEAAVKAFSEEGVEAYISLRNGGVGRRRDVQVASVPTQASHGFGASPRLCGVCGKPIVVGGNFCPYCGQRLMTAPGPAGEGHSANAAPASASDAFGTYDVVLEYFGNRKIHAIKVLREFTGLGLKEAKDLVEGVPRVVISGVDGAFAEAAVKAFSEVGVSASMRRR